MEPKVREYLTKLRAGSVPGNQGRLRGHRRRPGKDTRWHDVALLKPQTTTKEEVAGAQEEQRSSWGSIPHGNAAKKNADIDTSTLGLPKDPNAPPATTPPATAPIKQ